MGFSWHWEAWDSGLRDKGPLCTHSPSSCLVRPGRWVRISSHLALRFTAVALAQFLAQRCF